MDRYVTSQLAAKTADGMLTPLIDSDDDESDEESDFDSSASLKVETIKPTPMQVLKSLVVYLVLGAGIATSVAAMVYAPTIITYIMGGVCIANVPYSIIKERKLSKLPTLRSMNNKLREEANTLTGEVNVLTEEINALKPDADRASTVEKELKGITEKQSFNVNEIVELVKENESILVQMRENLRHRIFQDMVTLVMKSDTNNDHTIDRREADMLALRIRLQLEEYGVEFDSDKFLRAVGNCPSIPCVLSIAQKLLQPMSGVEADDDSHDSDEDDSDDEDIFDFFYVAEEDLSKSVVWERCKPNEGPHPTFERRGPTTLCQRRVSLMTCDKPKPSRRASLLSSCPSHENE